MKIFENPILRLGKNKSNYTSILKKSTIDKLGITTEISNSKKEEFKLEYDNKKIELKENIRNLTNAYKKINTNEIFYLCSKESFFRKK